MNEIFNINYQRSTYVKETSPGSRSHNKKQKYPPTTDNLSDKIQLSLTSKEMHVAKKAANTDTKTPAEKIEELKRSINNGSYKIDAEKVAEKIIGTILDETV